MFRTWPARLRHAFRGLAAAWKKDWTLAEHLLCAALVMTTGAVLRVSMIEWCLLTLCIGVVIGAELFNTALEQLAPAIDREHNPHIGATLDLSAAGVLIVALAAGVVGMLIFVFRLGVLLGWWPVA
jgi:diacylglycerol kinase